MTAGLKVNGSGVTSGLLPPPPPPPPPSPFLPPPPPPPQAASASIRASAIKRNPFVLMGIFLHVRERNAGSPAVGRLTQGGIRSGYRHRPEFARCGAG